MENDINEKNAPNQMRVFMKRMRDGKPTADETQDKPKQVLTVHESIKIMRKLNEEAAGETEEKGANMKNIYDQGTEEEKFLNFFDDMNVSVKFIDLEVNDNLVFWGATVDGIIQFIYTVTPDEATSGVQFNYLEDFTPDNPDNELIVKMIESYYDTFYKYWRDNVLANPSTEMPHMPI